MKKPFKLKPTWNPGLHAYVQYRENVHAEWLDAQVSQLTSNTITVFVFKFRVAHQINKFSMKEYIRKHPKDSVLNIQNTPSHSAMIGEAWAERRGEKLDRSLYLESVERGSRIDHPSDIEQAQEMVPTGMVLAVVGFVGFMLCALFWVVFQLVK